MVKNAMVDLTDCDREPIHIPGTIQPYGVLLVLAEPALTVAQVSENVGDHLPLGVEDVLGQPLSTMIDPASVDEVREALREERWHEMNPLHISAHGKRFDGIVHRHEGAAILELEPNPESDHRSAMHHPFRPALMRIQRVGTLRRARRRRRSANAASDRVRAGHVLSIPRGRAWLRRRRGERTGARAVSGAALSGLRHPCPGASSCIVKNWLRLIFDARATPARVVPTLRADTGGPLDLSFSVLRSVSPIHLEYMANMGVRASMSISLIVRDRLWGLISCLNHTSPRRVSHEMRMACEFLGRLTSLQIAALEDRDLLAARASRRATEDALADAMRESAAEDNVLEVLLAHPNGADGARGRRGGRAGERRGTCDVRPHAAAGAHPGHRGVGRRERKRPDRSPRRRWAPCSLGRRRPATSPVGCSRSLCPALPRGDCCGSARRSSRR